MSHRYVDSFTGSAERPGSALPANPPLITIDEIEELEPKIAPRSDAGFLD